MRHALAPSAFGIESVDENLLNAINELECPTYRLSDEAARQNVLRWCRARQLISQSP